MILSCFFLLCCEDEAARNFPNDFPNGKKVLVIGIDGCRSDILTSDIAPFMNTLLSKNSVAYNLEHKTEGITVSGPNWASICTGVHSEKHGVLENIFMNNKLKEYPHFYAHLNDFYGKEQVNLISYTVWFPINYFMNLYIADHSPVKFDYTDQEVFDLSKETLENNTPLNPDALFIHFDQVDHAGHAYGYHPDSANYVEAVKNVDKYVQDLYSLVAARKQTNGEDWLIVIVSDHGGEGYEHGGGADNPVIRNTILLLDNPSINNTGVLNASQQVDVAPTVLEFLGVDISQYDLDGQNLIE